MDLQLNEKRALVTGSSSGIGEAIALQLAREGVRVVVQGRRSNEVARVRAAIESAGGVAAEAVGDIGDGASAAAVAASAIDAFGGIDILVNSAGTAPLGGWFDTSPDVWRDVYGANVVGVVRMVQHLVPAMRERGWGRVINLGSIVASAPGPNIPHYTVTKAANVNQVVSLAKELAGTGVTVNAVSPGLIRTPATEPWMRAWAKARGWADDWAEIERNVATEIAPNPTKRLGHVEDVASVVAFLASPLASFVNGANVRVDGGANPTSN